jgi:hypothetical protein
MSVPPPRFFRPNPALYHWPIAKVDGIFAWGWVKGNREPQPLPLWLEVDPHALREVSRDGQDAQPALAGGQPAIRSDRYQPGEIIDTRTLRGLRRVWV